MATKKDSKAGGGGKGGEPRPRVVAWLGELSKAGQDMAKAKAVFNRVRDDKNKTDQEHFHRTLAQQSFVWYLGALRGKPMTGDELKAFAAEQVGRARAQMLKEKKD